MPKIPKTTDDLIDLYQSALPSLKPFYDRLVHLMLDLFVNNFAEHYDCIDEVIKLLTITNKEKKKEIFIKLFHFEKLPYTPFINLHTQRLVAIQKLLMRFPGEQELLEEASKQLHLIFKLMAEMRFEFNRIGNLTEFLIALNEILQQLNQADIKSQRQYKISEMIPSHFFSKVKELSDPEINSLIQLVNQGLFAHYGGDKINLVTFQRLFLFNFYYHDYLQLRRLEFSEHQPENSNFLISIYSRMALEETGAQLSYLLAINRLFHKKILSTRDYCQILVNIILHDNTRTYVAIRSIELWMNIYHQAREDHKLHFFSQKNQFRLLEELTNDFTALATHLKDPMLKNIFLAFFKKEINEEIYQTLIPNISKTQIYTLKNFYIFLVKHPAESFRELAEKIAFRLKMNMSQSPPLLNFSQPVSANNSQLLTKITKTLAQMDKNNNSMSLHP